MQINPKEYKIYSRSIQPTITCKSLLNVQNVDEFRICQILQQIHLMFKKKNIEKKADITKDLEEISIPSKSDGAGGQNKNSQAKRSNQQERHQEEQKLNEPKRAIRYGLIEKEVKQVEEKPKLENFFINMYIKRRMAEIQVKEKRDSNDTTASQILQMQKQYLSAAESKITEYDVKEIQKKLQKMATDHIKSELQARNAYLINLLQNQHERTEYASKKQIKEMKKQKEIMEKEILSKYNPSGRRFHVENMKQNHYSGIN